MKSKLAKPQPPLSEQEYADQAIASCEDRSGALLSILEKVQEHNPHKYLPLEILEYIAEKTGIPLAQVYSAVAFLANKILSSAYTDNTTVSAIQYAIWAIMDSPGPGPGGNNTPCAYDPTNCNTSDTGYWMNLALTTESAYSNRSIVFYSPDGNTIISGPDYNNCTYQGNSGQPCTAQEFIGETPEPLSMALMGTFLSLAGLALGKRKLVS